MATPPPLVRCQQCGQEMKPGYKVDKSMTLQLVGLLLCLLGLVLLFVFPIGTIIGIVIILLSLNLGLKRRKAWLCAACGYFFERA